MTLALGICIFSISAVFFFFQLMQVRQLLKKIALFERTLKQSKGIASTSTLYRKNFK